MSPRERHPIDVKADEVRAAERPRQVAYEHIDDVLAQWCLGALAKPPVVVRNHVVTLFDALIEREVRDHGRKLVTEPEWPVER